MMAEQHTHYAYRIRYVDDKGLLDIEVYRYTLPSPWVRGLA